MTTRKELIAQYKQNAHRLRSMGVFQVKNLHSGRVFLGASMNLDGALEREQRWLELGNHMNHQLQADWNAIGADAFVVEALETLTPTDEPRNYQEELALLLEAWMATLEPYDARGYISMPRRLLG
ncbi:MAG: LuxR family transcriptional regulator [Cyanobacteria bacterium RYN_339]|nr:LuxR family transcriptional regulator [Cyanobacteria bacterium RYN_339]